MAFNFPKHIQVYENIPLERYTSIRIGGKAQYVAEVYSQDDLIDIYQFCCQQNIRFLILGHGTNVFFSQKGFPGLVAVLKFEKIENCGDYLVRVDAGAPLSKLNRYCLDNSLAGFEFSSGIPGTVGGAIYGNAGAYGKNVGQHLQRAKIMLPDGSVKHVNKDFFEFAYRYSRLKRDPAIILDAEFLFQPGEYQVINEKRKGILELRRKKLPSKDVPTAGSYFKNIKDDFGNPIAAAKYLDAIGSKETSVGDAAVHQKHANIFFNKGHATAEHVLRLENILRDRVLDQFGICLEREVMYIE